ncbi:hypothetical protein QBC42DRAFT_176246 [Cladorrhinum samala]|uniref:SnoaL-like domain-containing protein n=1 Tax=Cladorrhinum samala TaxID=585594 RepID=A0AAV9HTP1_9PEZI|nr:hypothetical protein QBC42DRAFT_176246 [Cladorrhinum samala]
MFGIVLVALGVTPWASAAEPTASSLAASLERVESVREIKNMQKHFAQLAQYGRWGEMASLFSENGILRWGSNADPLSDSAATTAPGPEAIESWLREDAGRMDGIKPGSFHVLINDMPMISLSDDGRTAKGRWMAMKLLGDGSGGTRIEGGIFENQYSKDKERWGISLLRFYPIYHGNYEDGWRNAGPNGSVPIIPYHFTAEQAGLSLLSPDGPQALDSKVEPGPSPSSALEELEYRIARLNEEDSVRNLVHAMGYQVDRRLWSEVTSLFAPNGTITVDGIPSSPPGPTGLLSALTSDMGPAGLPNGTLNEHPIFGTIVSLSPDLLSATARGLEIGLIGSHPDKTAQWRFRTFHHALVKSPTTGIWQIRSLNYTSLSTANYSSGWGFGGASSSSSPPPFIPPSSPSGFLRPSSWSPFSPSPSPSPSNISTSSLLRSLSRSSAYDESESTCSAYGNYADDILCGSFALLHSTRGFKLSPGVGWYQTPSKISLACSLRYYSSNASFYDPPTANRLRSSVPLHWRLQPVILVSQDGRSATLRTRLLQAGTSKTAGSSGWNGGMYHDQLVLEDNRRKLWCLTIDEMYWTSRNWTTGWANVTRPDADHIDKNNKNNNNNGSSTVIGGSKPDVDVLDPALHVREEGFNGGPGKTVQWPGVQRMWWPYRNLVTGNASEDYWGPGCVPCRGARPDWLLTANGYQEPPTGPTEVRARFAAGGKVEVTVLGGPEETAAGGVVQLRADGEAEGAGLISSGIVGADGTVTLELAPGKLSEDKTSSLAVYYLGNERLQPGKTILAKET